MLMKLLLDSSHSNVSMDDIQVAFSFYFYMMPGTSCCNMFSIGCIDSNILFSTQGDLSPLVKQLTPGKGENGAQIPYDSLLHFAMMSSLAVLNYSRGYHFQLISILSIGFQFVYKWKA